MTDEAKTGAGKLPLPSRIGNLLIAMTLGAVSAYLIWVTFYTAEANDYFPPSKDYYTSYLNFLSSIFPVYLLIAAVAFAAILIGIAAFRRSTLGLFGGAITIVILISTNSAIICRQHGDSNRESKQNLIAVHLQLHKFKEKTGVFPRNVWNIRKEEYLSKFPRNPWHLLKSKYGDLNERTRQLFAGDSMPFDGPGGRFGENGGEMANLCTGHEIGYDLIEWWNFQPAKKGEDAERKTTREMAAGHFVYLPLDENDAMIPYGAPDGVKVLDYVLILFGPPDEPGIDFFTPSGNPDAPVTLTPDGIPDGVILVFEGVVQK